MRDHKVGAKISPFFQHLQESLFSIRFIFHQMKKLLRVRLSLFLMNEDNCSRFSREGGGQK